MKMKLEKFNYTFFVILICMSLSLLYSAWSYKTALNLIEDNQQSKYINIEQERDFNKWDLSRMLGFNLIFGLTFSILTIIYLIICTDFKNNAGG